MAGNDDQMVFRKDGIKTDAHAQGIKINIFERVIHRRFGKAEGFYRLLGHMQLSLREMLAQNRQNSFGHHSSCFRGHTGNNKNKFPCHV